MVVDQRDNGLPYFVVRRADGREARVNQAGDAARVVECNPGSRIRAMTGRGCVARAEATDMVMKEFGGRSRKSCAEFAVKWSGRCS